MSLFLEATPYIQWLAFELPIQQSSLLFPLLWGFCVKLVSVMVALRLSCSLRVMSAIFILLLVCSALVVQQYVLMAYFCDSMKPASQLSCHTLHFSLVSASVVLGLIFYSKATKRSQVTNVEKAVNHPLHAEQSVELNCRTYLSTLHCSSPLSLRHNFCEHSKSHNCLQVTSF
jgi:hypothetical protein